jgi:hypothetical protein
MPFFFELGCPESYRIVVSLDVLGGLEIAGCCFSAFPAVP